MIHIAYFSMAKHTLCYIRVWGKNRILWEKGTFDKVQKPTNDPPLYGAGHLLVSLCVCLIDFVPADLWITLYTYGNKHLMPCSFTRMASKVFGSVGGGEESRTPVRKPVHTAFFGCSRLFAFPPPPAKRQAGGFSSSWYNG